MHLATSVAGVQNTPKISKRTAHYVHHNNYVQIDLIKIFSPVISLAFLFIFHLFYLFLLIIFNVINYYYFHLILILLYLVFAFYFQLDIFCYFCILWSYYFYYLCISLLHFMHFWICIYSFIFLFLFFFFFFFLYSCFQFTWNKSVTWRMSKYNWHMFNHKIPRVTLVWQHGCQFCPGIQRLGRSHMMLY